MRQCFNLLMPKDEFEAICALVREMNDGVTDPLSNQHPAQLFYSWWQLESCEDTRKDVGEQVKRILSTLQNQNVYSVDLIGAVAERPSRNSQFDLIRMFRNRYFGDALNEFSVQFFFVRTLSRSEVNHMPKTIQVERLFASQSAIQPFRPN